MQRILAPIETDSPAAGTRCGPRAAALSVGVRPGPALPSRRGPPLQPLPPSFELRVESSTLHHWVATCGDIVLVFVYEGSADDGQHVAASVRAIERAARTSGRSVRLLSALPAAHARPPSAVVRKAVTEAASRVAPRIARSAFVVSGTGFASAIHRGAITGVLALARPGVPIRVEGSISEGLASLIDRLDPLFAPLLEVCAARIQGPAADAR